MALSFFSRWAYYRVADIFMPFNKRLLKECSATRDKNALEKPLFDFIHRKSYHRAFAPTTPFKKRLLLWGVQMRVIEKPMEKSLFGFIHRKSYHRAFAPTTPFQKEVVALGRSDIPMTSQNKGCIIFGVDGKIS